MVQVVRAWKPSLCCKFGTLGAFPSWEVFLEFVTCHLLAEPRAGSVEPVVVHLVFLAWVGELHPFGYY